MGKGGTAKHVSAPVDPEILAQLLSSIPAGGDYV